jgi:hypothetical protein
MGNKTNSELGSKFQTKVEFDTTGVIGPIPGREVFTEVVLRVRCKDATSGNKILVKARMAVDDEWEEISTVYGSTSHLIHVASWDYIQFDCLVHEGESTLTLLSSAFFSEGIIASDAINLMNNELKAEVRKVYQGICALEDNIKSLNRQMELITDHEEHEVK